MGGARFNLNFVGEVHVASYESRSRINEKAVNQRVHQIKLENNAVT